MARQKTVGIRLPQQLYDSLIEEGLKYGFTDPPLIIAGLLAVCRNGGDASPMPIHHETKPEANLSNDSGIAESFDIASLNNSNQNSWE